MSDTDGVPTTVHSVRGPLTTWLRKLPPQPQVGERTSLIINNTPTVTVQEKRQRTELTIFEKREICRSQSSVKQIEQKYGISRRAVYEIRKTGIDHYQKLINRNMGNQHRNRGFNERGGDYSDANAEVYDKAEAMLSVHRACEQASALWCPLTKSMVIDLIRQKTRLTSITALEDTYQRFKKHYGWVWRRWGRTQCLAPSDVEFRISQWAEKFYTQNTVRKYRFAFFGDETAMFVNGEVQGYTLAPIGCPQPKVVDTNPKETVTAFLAGVYDFALDKVFPLYPTVIFEHNAKNRESSTIYTEMTRLAYSLSGIYIDVSRSGWVTDDVYERMLKKYLHYTLDNPSTVIITDDYTAHRTNNVPTNCDPQTIPGGCTKAIQFHDRVFNRLFKRQYNELLSAWRLRNSVPEGYSCACFALAFLRLPRQGDVPKYCF